MTVARAVARAWKSPDYRKLLLERPKVALGEVGVDVPEEIAIEVVTNTPRRRYFLLPLAPRNASDLSIRELERLAEEFLRPFDDLIES